MKNINIGYILFTSSAIFFIAAIAGFFKDREVDINHITLGCALFCIGCSVKAAEKKKAGNKETRLTK